MKHLEFKNQSGYYSRQSLVMMRLVAALIAIAIIPISVKGQNLDASLLQEAEYGNPSAMAKIAAALVSQDEAAYGKKSFSWARKSADKGDSRGCSLLAYHFYKGIGIQPSIQDALFWATRSAILGDDGLGSWILAHLRENETNQYIMESYRCQYPVALLFYSRLYATGSEEFAVPKDETKSLELLEKAAQYDLSNANYIVSFRNIVSGISGQKDYDIIKKASASGIPVAMSLLATMSIHGDGVDRDEESAFALFEKSAESGDSIGIEGLADCYRIGIGVGQNQEKAFEMYSKVYETSPRAKYLLACYKNEGIGTQRDSGDALRLFMESSNEGSVFSQAILGVSFYNGSQPAQLKDTEEASRLLRMAVENKRFDSLPDDLKSRVLEYASACYRYGFGVEENDETADELHGRYRQLNAAIPLSRPPFGLEGALSLEDISVVPSVTDLSEDDIFNLFTFDYPEFDGSSANNMIQVLPDEPAESLFSDSSLQDFFVKVLGKDGEGNLTYEDLASLKSLDNIKLDNSLTSFDEFEYFKGIKVIPAMYFQGFSQLASISIPESVTDIKNNAFLGCSSLTQIVIPSSVTSIGDWAFANCDRLKSLVCEALIPPKVGDNFLAHADDVSIYVPKASLNLYKNSPGWKSISKRIKAMDKE